MRIERVRHAIAPDGTTETTDDAIELTDLGARRLEDEARAAGLVPEPVRRIAATDEHVGSEVVLLRG